MMVSSRRRLMGGVAIAAGLAGVGAAWWKYQPAPILSGAEDALWRLSFDTPNAGPLAMETLRGKPLLLNFWATWCPPCVEEMPMINRFFQENAGNGWQVLGLAVDQPSSVRTFLQKTPVAYPVAMAGLGGTDLGRALGNLAGGLPFTVVLGSTGSVLHRKMGQVSPADLRALTGLK